MMMRSFCAFFPSLSSHLIWLSGPEKLPTTLTQELSWIQS